LVVKADHQRVEMRRAPEPEDGEARGGVLGGEVACGGEEGGDGEGILHRSGERDAGDCPSPVNEEVPAVTMRLFSCYCLACEELFSSIADYAGLVY